MSPDDKSNEVTSTPRTDAEIARALQAHGKGGTTMIYKLNDMEAFARQLELDAATWRAKAKRWQEIADQRAIEVADLKVVTPSAVAPQEPVAPFIELAEVLEEYDQITDRLDPRDYEADFVMRGADWRVVREAIRSICSWPVSASGASKGVAFDAERYYQEYRDGLYGAGWQRDETTSHEHVDSLEATVNAALNVHGGFLIAPPDSGTSSG